MLKKKAELADSMARAVSAEERARAAEEIRTVPAAFAYQCVDHIFRFADSGAKHATVSQQVQHLNQRSHSDHEKAFFISVPCS